MQTDSKKELEIEVPSVDSEGNYDAFDVMEFLAQTNTPEYTILKTIEELAELQEKLIKYYLKQPAYKPSMVEISDEVGDVMLRIISLVCFLKLEDLCEKRGDSKCNRLMEIYKSGKFDRGV